jgi:hypothetical protein
VLALAGIATAVALAAVPNNTAPPSVSGNAREGETVTASNGTWANDPTQFAYQWQRCGADRTGCAAISGATNKSYTLANADTDHRVRVVVSASNADGQSSSTSATTAVVSGTGAPVNTARPSISGTPTVGEELSASNGTWTGGARTFSYQWQRCDSTGGSCANVIDANSRVYGVRSADSGHRMRVVVTARNDSGSRSSATSDATSTVRPTGSGGTPTVRNKAPSISILSLKRLGVRVYIRFRVCDDATKPVTTIERDVKLGVLSYTRRFAAMAKPCKSHSRNWMLPSRFRHGRYTVQLRAVDKSGTSSRTVSRSIFHA